MRTVDQVRWDFVAVDRERKRFAIRLQDEPLRRLAEALAKRLDEGPGRAKVTEAILCTALQAADEALGDLARYAASGKVNDAAEAMTAWLQFEFTERRQAEGGVI